ncbi:MAG: sigma-70 family RNA polymerase sigma factor [Acidimicrobiales bacterium]
MVLDDSEVGFRAFVTDVEPRLRRALIAAYGYERGREATAEALAYAWEHWGRISKLRNPAGYLYRVGQSRTRSKKMPIAYESHTFDDPRVEPSLVSALTALPERQRAAVFLVHGAGWTHAETAELLGIKESTVQKHVERALQRLRRTVVRQGG